MQTKLGMDQDHDKISQSSDNTYQELEKDYFMDEHSDSMYYASRENSGSLFAKKYSEISLGRINQNQNSLDKLLMEDQTNQRAKYDEDVMSAREQQSFRK